MRFNGHLQMNLSADSSSGLFLPVWKESRWVEFAQVFLQDEWCDTLRC